MKLNSCEKKVLRKLKTQNLDIKTLIKVFHLVCYNLCVAAASQLMSQKIKTTYKASTSKVIKL